MNGEKFRVGLIQMDSSDDWANNKKQAERYIREAAEEGADVVILPETADYIGPDMGGHATSIPGPVSEFFREQAVKYGLILHCGSMTERMEEGMTGNTSLVFGPDGRILAEYRKLHLFDVELKDGPSYRESADVAGGNEIAMVQTRFCTMGLSICYDLRFPELYRLMAGQGAELLINCANFTANTGKMHWEPLLKARAIENTCYVAAVGQCGRKPRYRAWGHTMLIDPWGEIAAAPPAADEPGLAVGEIDPAKLKSAREQIPSLRNRRTDVYALSSDRLHLYGEEQKL